MSLSLCFQGLRIRNLYNERRASIISSGDVFVTTWASVAATNSKARKIRKNGDQSIALDDFIPSLRELGFRIGVIVDEAHHGFTKAPEAVRVYKEVMQPDFTFLITATPNDSDVEKFRQATNIQKLHRIRVSRKDAVDAGLIKEGVRSIAYLASDNQKPLVDFVLTALTDAWAMHKAIQHHLQMLGVDFTPLMMVQVANIEGAVEEVRKRLEIIGVPTEAIAWYTAQDPNDDLLAVAKDETKQVLIFKIAAGLGFDAPRAFTLVSLRGAQDKDFGIQVIGRILRVHPTLQGHAIEKTLPDILKFGYVFLADPESQTALIGAAENINSIITELSEICPYRMIVKIGSEEKVSVIQNIAGKVCTESYMPTELAPSIASKNGSIANNKKIGLLSSLLVTPTFSTTEVFSGLYSAMISNRICSIKPEIPRVFKTEHLSLSIIDKLIECMGKSLAIDDEVLNAGLRQNIQIRRRQVSIFEDDASEEEIEACLSKEDIIARAQSVLSATQHIDPRDLLDILFRRLAVEYKRRGMSEVVKLPQAVNLILATHPNLLNKAAKHCASYFRELIETSPLPEQVEVSRNSKKSRLNIYGIIPEDLNKPEQDFAYLLDTDVSGTVVWWFRNLPQKPWAIGVILADGNKYYPDFVVKVRGWKGGDEIRLIEVKGNHILNDDTTLLKTIAEHKIYGRPLMLLQQENSQFITIRYNEHLDKNEADRVFNIDNLPWY